MQLRLHPIKPFLLLWIIWSIWQRVISCECDHHHVESSPNVERNFNDFSLRCTRKLHMLCADRKLPSFPFLACHFAVSIAGIHINFVKPKRSQMLWVQSFIEKGVCIRESPRRGQWQSPLQVCHQCRPMGSRYSRVVWHGVGMNANLCSWSFGYGRKAPCWNRLVRRATCKHR